MSSGTYINVYRKFKNWKWYKDPVTKSIFLHLLIEARWNAAVIHGVKLKRGQLLTTETDLAEELGLTRQQVRTGLNHLISTKEITKQTTKVITDGLTKQSTNRMSLIIIENYGLYQKKGSVTTKQSTEELTEDLPSNQPSVNQTTFILNKENKDINKDINNSACACAREGPVDNFNDDRPSSPVSAKEIELAIEKRRAEGKSVSQALLAALEYRRKVESGS